MKFYLGLFVYKTSIRQNAILRVKQVQGEKLKGRVGYEPSDHIPCCEVRFYNCFQRS